MAQVEAFAHRLCGCQPIPRRCRVRRHTSAFARLVGDRDHAAAIDRRLRHQRFAVGLIGRDRAFVARCRRRLHQHFAVGLIGRDVPLPSIVAVNWKACLVSTRYPRFMQQSLSQPRRLYK